jgi:hypothetical protein
MRPLTEATPALALCSLLLTATLLLVSAPLPVSADVTTLWPQPQSVTNGTTTVAVDSANFVVALSTDSANCQQSSSPPNALFEAAAQRYAQLIFWNGPGNGAGDDDGDDRGDAPRLTALTVCIASDTIDLQMGVDESIATLCAHAHVPSATDSALTTVSVLFC